MRRTFRYFPKIASENTGTIQLTIMMRTLAGWDTTPGEPRPHSAFPVIFVCTCFVWYGSISPRLVPVYVSPGSRKYSGRVCAHRFPPGWFLDVAKLVRHCGRKRCSHWGPSDRRDFYTGWALDGHPDRGRARNGRDCLWCETQSLAHDSG